jgi:ribonuclease HII
MSYDNHIIAGIDEAGRGPLFGPVVACAVIFNENIDTKEIKDSKKISGSKRQKIYDKLIQENINYGIGIVHEKEIDEINILNATKKAMLLAVEKLEILPSKLLIDGNQVINTNINQETIIRGDQKISEISAASIIAKVSRDRLIKKLAKIHHRYFWHKNAGYGTKDHLRALKKFGVTKYHRKKFKPIHNILSLEK